MFAGIFLHPDWKNHFVKNFPRFKAVGEVLMDELPEDSDLYENALEIFNSGQKGRVLVNEIMSLGSRTDS